MIDNNEELIEETLDNLIDLMEEDHVIFFKSYKSLPLDIYTEIERLSVSKSTLYRDLCIKARKVADNFHKSIK